MHAYTIRHQRIWDCTETAIAYTTSSLPWYAPRSRAHAACSFSLAAGEGMSSFREQYAPSLSAASEFVGAGSGFQYRTVLQGRLSKGLASCRRGNVPLVQLMPPVLLRCPEPLEQGDKVLQIRNRRQDLRRPSTFLDYPTCVPTRPALSHFQFPSSPPRRPPFASP